jgi:magnesium chelatase family protein
MVARCRTVAFQGIEVMPVEAQVQLSNGLPAFHVVGLADKAVAESRERVRGALGALGLSLPPRRITVNLAPADLPKEGSHYDLPIALALLAAMGVLPPDALDGYLALGELGLDGAVGAVTGILPAALSAHAQDRGLICPQSQGSEAAWAGDAARVLATPSLLALINHFKGSQVLPPPRPGIASEDTATMPDLRDIKGQESAKRALEVAAAGSHNLLLIGPPGAGKSMLAQRLPGILPPLDSAEILEVSMIASLAGQLPDGKLTRRRPVRPSRRNDAVHGTGGGASACHRATARPARRSC